MAGSPADLAPAKQPAPPAPVVPVAAEAPEAPPSIEQDTSGDTAPTAPAPPGDSATLRQILQELRNQRVTEGEFSYLKVLAIVLQMVAAVCLLGALWVGGQDTNAFLRFLGTGILLQLATIAMLLFNR